MNKNDIKSDERVCYNCKHMLWMVAIGQGVRCGYAVNEIQTLPMIPHLRHTCDKFDTKVKPKTEL